MNCYLDSSVVLRKVLRQSNSLEEWSALETGFSSRLLQLECLRSIDRLRLLSDLSAEQMVESRTYFFELIRKIGLLPMTEAVIKRAEEPFHSALGSLDSIHLSTALFLRERHGRDFLFATHDKELALAAKAYGFNVIGS